MQRKAKEMQREHLTYEELERYLDDNDLSEEYLCWSEPITEHLDTCAVCRERLDKMLFLSQLLDENNMADVMHLVKKENEIRRRQVALRLELMAEEQRMMEVAKRLQMGMLMALSASKTELVRGRSVARGGEDEKRPANAYYEDGILYITVKLEKEADVAVVLVCHDTKDAQPEMKKAKWDAERKEAVAAFEIAELGEKYEAFVDIQDV